MRMFAMVAAAGLLIAGPSTPAPAADPIKIGFIGSITGYGSILGDPEVKAAKLRVKTINAAGGINGRPVELLIHDSEGSPEKAVLAMKRLITQDKVPAVVGPDLSSTVRAVMPLVEESKVISFVMTPVIKPPAGSYMFGIYPIQEHAYEAELVWLKKKTLTKLGVLASTDTTGQEGVKFLRELAGKHGITLAVENFNLQDVDVSPQLLTLQRGGAQAIMAAMSGKPFAVVAKGMKQLNMKLPLLASTGAVTKTLGELIRGIEPEILIAPTLKVMVAEQLPDTDENKAVIMQLIKSFRQEYKEEPDLYAAAGWDATEMVLKAYAAAGPDPTAMRDWLEKMPKYVGTVCTVTMKPTDHHGCDPEGYVLVQFKNGKFVLEK